MTDSTSDPDVLVAGETLVDFLPETGGPLSAVERFVRRPGGAPANVAVALARLGPAPWFWTRIGADPFGDLLADTLDDHGLPERFVERDPDAATTLAFVSDHDDDPAFTFYRDGTADTRLEAGTVPDDVLESVRWCYVGGVALAAEPARTAVFDLVDRARGRGCTVAFDPNARPELWGEEGAGRDGDAGGSGGEGTGGCSPRFAEVAGRMVERVDLVVATPADLRAAGFGTGSSGDGTDANPNALAEAVCERGPHTAFVTLGAEGAVGHATGRAPWGPADASHDGFSVEAVDATGAGDAFAAGAIRSLAEGSSLAEAIAFANAVAAASTAERGAMSALPDRETADAIRRS